MNNTFGDSTVYIIIFFIILWMLLIIFLAVIGQRRRKRIRDAQGEGMVQNSPEASVGVKIARIIRIILGLAIVVFVIFVIQNVSYHNNMKTVNEAVESLQSDNFETRLSAVIELSKIDETEAKAALLMAMKDKDSVVRSRAVNAIFGWMDDRALTALLEALSDSDEGVRRMVGGCLYCFASGGTSSNKPTEVQVKTAEEALDRSFEEKNYPVIAGASDYYIGLGREGTEPGLIEALNQCGTKAIAEGYLNCGNEKLSEAAEKWASVNGYTILAKQNNMTLYVGWGSRQK